MKSSFEKTDNSVSINFQKNTYISSAMQKVNDMPLLIFFLNWRLSVYSNELFLKILLLLQL